MRLFSCCLILALLSGCGRPEVVGGPLSLFNGRYKIIEGAEGTVEVRPAVGGTYAELQASFDNPSHELRVIVGAARADGTFPVWRFEQKPAPKVPNDGVGRLQNGELVTDFVAAADPDHKLLRERWNLTGDTQLEFTLEAASSGGTPRRVGGFIARRK